MLFSEAVFAQVMRECVQHFGLAVTPLQESQVKIFIQEFIRWNAVHNLSATASFDELMITHVADSLSVIPSVNRYLQELETSGPKSLADLGAGGGFPSLLIAILLPSVNVYAIESIKKKTAFLQHSKTRLKLANLTVIDERIESYAQKSPQTFDATISRAFTELSNFLAYSENLIKLGGLVFAMKSQKVFSELKSMSDDWMLLENIELTIPRLDAYRCLLVVASMRK